MRKCWFLAFSAFRQCFQKPPLGSLNWIVWYGVKLYDCMVFSTTSTLFQLYHRSQSIYPCFPGVILTSIPHNILSHITIIKTIDSSVKRMNSVAMDIINPHREYWPSRRIEPGTSCSQVLALGDKGLMKKVKFLYLPSWE